jgi:hypothetical protein
MIGLNVTIQRTGENSVNIHVKPYAKGDTPGEREEIKLMTLSLGKAGCLVRKSLEAFCAELPPVIE